MICHFWCDLCTCTSSLITVAMLFLFQLAVPAMIHLVHSQASEHQESDAMHFYYDPNTVSFFLRLYLSQGYIYDRLWQNGKTGKIPYYTCINPDQSNNQTRFLFFRKMSFIWYLWNIRFMQQVMLLITWSVTGNVTE